MSSFTLLDAVTGATTSGPKRIHRERVSLQIFNNASGTTSTVLWEGTNEETPTTWAPIYQMTITENSESTAKGLDVPYEWIRAKATVVTAGAVSALIGAK